MERLAIDCTHWLRQRSSTSSPTTALQKKQHSNRNQAILTSMVWRLVEQLAFDGSVSFATIRSLARRLKQPLSVSLSPNGSREATLLGLRLESSNGTTATATTTSTTDRADSPAIDSSKHNDKHTSRYTDWTPPTDRTVATALAGPPDGQNVGRRCSYVGFEETEHYTGKTDPMSMNVEKLAMEFYNAGHLPSKTILVCREGAG